MVKKKTGYCGLSLGLLVREQHYDTSTKVVAECAGLFGYPSAGTLLR